MRPVAGIPLVEFVVLCRAGRILSELGSQPSIIVSGPIMFLTAVAVRLDSPGPVIYRNRRVGEAGRELDT